MTAIRRVPLSRPFPVHPLWFLLAATVLATLPAMMSTTTQQQEWGQFWILSADDLLIQSLGFGSLALGMAVSGRTAVHPHLEFSEAQVDRLDGFTRVLFWLTIAGYVVWFGAAVAQNGVSFLLGGAGEAQKVDTVPGLTTLTQVGPYVIAACTLLTRLGRARRGMLVVMLVLGTVRVFANSERLALLELFLPMMIVLAMVPSPGRAERVATVRRWPSGISFLAWTTAGLAALVGFFALSERSRSWTFYASRTDHGLLAFSLERIEAYYATATNNSALYYHGLEPDLVRPETFLQFLWEFPLIGGVLRSLVGGDQRPLSTVWLQYLSGHSNPEFNNTGAILPILGELGLLAGPVLLALTGMAVAGVYRRACSGSPAALLAYAVLTIGVLELPRFFYYGQGRAFPILVVALLGAAYLRLPQPLHAAALEPVR